MSAVWLIQFLFSGVACVFELGGVVSALAVRHHSLRGHRRRLHRRCSSQWETHRSRRQRRRRLREGSRPAHRGKQLYRPIQCITSSRSITLYLVYTAVLIVSPHHPSGVALGMRAAASSFSLLLRSSLSLLWSMKERKKLSSEMDSSTSSTAEWVLRFGYHTSN